MNKKNYHVIYYSDRCNHSKELINELHKNNLLSNFEKLCIDFENIKNILPPEVKEVPTIIVPEYDGLLIGKDAFNWIKWKIKQNQNHAAAQNNNNNIQTKKGVSSFQSISNGFSDTFSSWDSQEDIGSINKNFSNLEQDVSGTIITKNQENFENIGQDSLMKKFQEMEQERNEIKPSPTSY